MTQVPDDMFRALVRSARVRYGFVINPTVRRDRAPRSGGLRFGGGRGSPAVFDLGDVPV